MRKPQNRTEIPQITANRIGFFPEYRNRTYMEAHFMKADLKRQNIIRPFSDLKSVLLWNA